MIKWEKLPENMKNPAVKEYYDRFNGKKASLLFKRLFDVAASTLMIAVLSPLIAVLAVWIKTDSEGPVFYRQERVTRYGRVFRIFKFRTMVVQADQIGALVTSSGDSRITGVGAKIRHSRLDEIPQLFNVFRGEMSFVGTRPEVPKYVEHYTDEMKATLLLPAGVTSTASIRFKDEDVMIAELTAKGMSVDEAYADHVLPEKMKYNLEYLKEFGFLKDLGICIKTLIE